MAIYHYNRDQGYKIKVGEHVLFYYAIKKSLSEFCIKLNIPNAEEQKPISQMSASSVYVYVKHLKLK